MTQLADPEREGTNLPKKRCGEMHRLGNMSAHSNRDLALDEAAAIPPHSSLSLAWS